MVVLFSFNRNKLFFSSHLYRWMHFIPVWPVRTLHYSTLLLCRKESLKQRSLQNSSIMSWSQLLSRAWCLSSRWGDKSNKNVDAPCCVISPNQVNCLTAHSWTQTWWQYGICLIITFFLGYFRKVFLQFDALLQIHSYLFSRHQLPHATLTPRLPRWSHPSQTQDQVSGPVSR